MKNELSFDVVVIGGGHAGCEAAAASARLGVNTALFTHKFDTIGEMSCNPAMGGIAKGQIIREIDAIGGESGIISDFSAIKFRMLNKSKGPAMWSPRVQSDRNMFSKLWRETLEKTDKLDFYQESVVELLIIKNNNLDSPQSIAANLNIHPFVAKSYHRASNRYSIDKIKQILEYLSELDLVSKGIKSLKFNLSFLSFGFITARQ